MSLSLSLYVLTFFLNRKTHAHIYAMLKSRYGCTGSSKQCRVQRSSVSSKGKVHTTIPQVYSTIYSIILDK